MRQVLHSLKDGCTELVDLPCGSVGRGCLLIRTSYSLISAGTERMLVDFGKANWVDKARQQPDKVKMVLDKVKTDGLAPTVASVRNKLDQPLPMGYCNVGAVLEVGVGVDGFAGGDRVASNGKHAEVVNVPRNLCAKVPEGVSDDEAVFTVIGAVALQGIRLVQPALGEAVVVTGLGLIGLITIQLLRAHGCRVLGIDFDRSKLDLARRFGAEVVDLSQGEGPELVGQRFSRGRGVDAVIITASTKSNEPVHQAAQMCRKRGRIVLVGMTGLELSRADFFAKELSFQVSCSYGPGRYDPNYEEKGHDYPVGFVRWTEQRNFEAVLDMMADGRLDVKPMISHRLNIEEVEKAYEHISGDGSSLGVLLQYPSSEDKSEAKLRESTVVLPACSRKRQPITISLAFVGAGNYATAVLIPAFKETGARLKSVASSGGVSGTHAGRKFGFEQSTTSTDEVFRDPDVNAIVVTTRHNSHASFVCKALEAGKHVFVEKPLALTGGEIEKIESAYGNAQKRNRPPLLMVGFNRRFSPQIQKIKTLLNGVREPKSFVMTVNAGAIPVDHWTQDTAEGGGRIVGEACHFIDLLRFLADASIDGYTITALNASTTDTASLLLCFDDGSIGTVHYFANGNKSYPKERLEVFCAGRVLQLDNFRKLKGFGWPGFKKMNLMSQDKGQKMCAAAFVRALEKGREAPIPFAELIEVSRVAIDIAAAVKS